MAIDMKKVLLYLLYIVLLISIYPIIRYFYFSIFDRFTSDVSFYVKFRVYFSGPLLIFFGAILAIGFTGINRFFGFISILLGISCLLMIFKAILEEVNIL